MNPMDYRIISYRFFENGLQIMRDIGQLYWIVQPIDELKYWIVNSSVILFITMQWIE